MTACRDCKHYSSGYCLRFVDTVVPSTTWSAYEGKFVGGYTTHREAHHINTGPEDCNLFNPRPRNTSLWQQFATWFADTINL